MILVGPSGVGKKTLIDLVLAEYGDIFERKKSVTTRPKRGENEKAAENFTFVNEADFNKMVSEDAFVEYQERSKNCWYGTSQKELDRIMASGKIPIIEVDVEGAKKINDLGKFSSNFLFIYPPSFEELRKRIGNRIETEAEFKVRIKEAIR